MGERKVLNHYVSPDFDPSLVPRTRKDKGKPIEVRTMIPFSMRCNTCSEYMYLGKKFNCKMEVLQDEQYLGIRLRRFYIRCTSCSAEITYKTDPKNSGYELESGASRNFESWRDSEEKVADAKTQRQEDDKADAIKKLENRTMDNKREMDVLDQLDELRAINQRHERADTNAIIASLSSSTGGGGGVEFGPDGLTDSERALLQAARFKHNKGALPDSDDESGVVCAGDNSIKMGEGAFNIFDSKPAQVAEPKISIVRKKRKVEAQEDPTTALIADPLPKKSAAALSSLANYDSD
jgi:hypothetical protein